MTALAVVETALAAGELWASMTNGRWWRLRRNGATQRWKTRPDKWQIPVKCGLRTCSRVTNAYSIVNCGEPGWRKAVFVIATGDPNVA